MAGATLCTEPAGKRQKLLPAKVGSPLWYGVRPRNWRYWFNPESESESPDTDSEENSESESPDSESETSTKGDDEDDTDGEH